MNIPDAVFSKELFEEVRDKRTLVMLDVRSPKEFSSGHVPFAQSMPLFSDEERAHVGTVYKQVGKDAAVLEGLRYVGPKLAQFVETARKIAEGRSLFVYCFRGGMRSQSMVWLLRQAGLEAHCIKGGYKSFRKWAMRHFEAPWSLSVIGGYTGSGKTELLQQVAFQKQTLDLEKLARHRGSAFGHTDLQPTQETFENHMAVQLAAFDPQKLILVEDESRLIGTCCIPHPFFLQMQAAPLFFIETEKRKRIERIVAEYSVLGQESLLLALNKLKKRLGLEKVKLIAAAIARQDYSAAVNDLLHYYDRAYEMMMTRRKSTKYFITADVFLAQLLKDFDLPGLSAQGG